MTGDLHQRASEVFARVRRVRAGERGAALDAACSDDEELRREVESLLRFAGEASDFLETPALGSGFAEAVGAAVPEEPVERVGRYRVVGVLGEGGMGIVYRAEQERPRRVVALKMMRFGFASETARRRFEREGELLARLHHPGIAQVFETGTDERGRPFIAMEMVEGEPIDVYVREDAPAVGDRLGLVLQVCDAVQHAHQRGVIHRDVKAANVLVERGGEETSGRTETGAGARVKVLDFGVGRLIGEDAGGTVRTEAGQLVGTLRSMSPEQLAGDPEVVDARADVYALGVLAYEVLSGVHPFGSVDGGIAEMSAAVRGREPARLGTIDRSLRGDLETVVARAMEKDPARRYQSAGEFAADIRRFLAGEAVLARPASAAYQLRKLAGRHRAAAAALAAVLVVVVAAVVGIGWQAVRATHAEHLANERSEVADEQTRIANAVNAFLQSILSAGDARNGGNPEITVREALDNAASTVGERFAGEPLVEAGIRRVIGDTYRSLGLPAKALEHLEASVTLYRANAPEADPLRLQAVGDLAILYDDMNRKADAAALYAEDLRLRRVVDGPEAESTLVAEVNYAGVLLVAGDLEGAERAYASCLERMREALGEENTNTIVTMQHLADLYTRLRRDDEAEALVTEAVAAWEAIGQGEHPYSLVAINNLAQLYGRTGRAGEALEMRTRAYDIATRTMGESHPTTMALLAMLAKSTAAEGRVEEALGMTERAIASLEASVGREHLNTVQLLHERVELLRTLERFEEALEASTVSLEAARAMFPANDPKLAIGLSVRAEVLLALERAEEAVPVLRETLEIYEGSLGEGHADTARAAARLREVLEMLDRSEDAVVGGGGG